MSAPENAYEYQISQNYTLHMKFSELYFNYISLVLLQMTT